MKKLLVIILLLGVVSMAFTANTAYFVVEKDMGYEQDPLWINEGEEKVVAEITFNLPSSGHVLFYTLCDWTYQRMDPQKTCIGGSYMTIDGDSTSRTTTRALYFDTGEHTLQWVSWSNDWFRQCYSYFWCQVMVFYTEESSVSEKPPYVEPTHQTASIITSAPAVYIPECSEIKDITGRTINCEIEDGWVSLNTLSAGTYFAKGSTGRTTKIVKTK